ncbi:MAG: hypothetical protein UX28_C0004G0035, partial [Candidatus Pacebacteria bacterium GW2011_GWA1_46_10]
MTEKTEISSTTQVFLDIFDITNNVVVLKNGTVSIVLLISAMNFGLLAEQEQDSVIYSYAALLNSLNFPIQIVINSKTKDATAYLRLLEIQAQQTPSQAKRDLIQRYQTFVGQLIKERNVLDKKFYVVIPALPIEVGMMTPQTLLPGKQAPQITQEQKAAVIEKGIGILEPRRDHLIAQFNRIGLYARQLATQEIIEIFYNNYNPEAYEGQQITDSQNYTTAVVNAGTVTPPIASQTSIETTTPAMPQPTEPPTTTAPALEETTAQTPTEQTQPAPAEENEVKIAETNKASAKDPNLAISPVILPKTNTAVTNTPA